MPVTPSNFGLDSFAFPVVEEGSGSCDYPAESDVREGVAYDSGNLVGTLVVPTSGDPDDDVSSHSPADISRRVFIKVGLGLAPPSTPWPVYAGGEPDEPESVITVYDTSPQDDGRTGPDGQRQQHYGIQVRVRAATHRIAYGKARELVIAMNESIYQETITLDAGLSSEASYLLSSFSRVGNPINIGKDVPRSKRSIFTINALVSVRRLA